MSKIIQTSCSELLVDTRIYDPEKAFKIFTKLFKEVEWESSPPLTLNILKELQREFKEEEDESEERVRVMVYDKFGNRANLEYGDNGYIHTGYRFDSECSDGDEKCYPIFEQAIEKLGGELISCDGGHKSGYEDWKDEKDNPEEEEEE